VAKVELVLTAEAQAAGKASRLPLLPSERPAPVLAPKPIVPTVPVAEIRRAHDPSWTSGGLRARLTRMNEQELRSIFERHFLSPPAHACSSPEKLADALVAAPRTSMVIEVSSDMV